MPPTNDVVTEFKTTLGVIEDGMKAFKAFQEDVAPKVEKMDGFDAAKFAKMSEDIGKAIEQTQKEAGTRKAAEEHAKAQVTALETQIKALEIAVSRAPAGAAGDEAKAKELAQKRKQIFNEFARTPGQAHFDTYLAERIKADPELKALSAGSDSAGGYLVMPESGGVITTKVFETSPIRQLATVETVGTDQYEVVTDADEAAAGWVGELGTRSETNTPALSKVIIPVNEIYANPRATQKMLDDGIIDVESWLAGKVADIFARTEATAFVSGNGRAKPRGLLSYDAGTTISSFQVEQVNSGTAGAFTYDGLVDLQNALKEEYQANAAFLIKRATNAALMKLKDGESRPIFNMTYDKNVGVQPSILGKPVYFANDMEAIASASLSAIYGDIRRAYLIVDRIGLRVLRDPFSAKPYVQFYTTKRVGAGTVNFEAYKIQKLS